MILCHETKRHAENIKIVRYYLYLLGIIAILAVNMD